MPPIQLMQIFGSFLEKGKKMGLYTKSSGTNSSKKPKLKETSFLESYHGKNGKLC